MVLDVSFNSFSHLFIYLLANRNHLWRINVITEYGLDGRGVGVTECTKAVVGMEWTQHLLTCRAVCVCAVSLVDTWTSYWSLVVSTCRCPIIESPLSEKSPPADNLPAKMRPARRGRPGEAHFYR